MTLAISKEWHQNNLSDESRNASNAVAENHGGKAELMMYLISCVGYESLFDIVAEQAYHLLDKAIPITPSEQAWQKHKAFESAKEMAEILCTMNKEHFEENDIDYDNIS